MTQTEALKLLVEALSLYETRTDGLVNKALAAGKEALAQPKEPDPVEIWRDDAPPKRGAYKVKRVGEASTQRGYSYWDGEMWGMIFSRRSLAQEYKTSARKRKSQYAMQWLQKAAHGIKE